MGWIYKITNQINNKVYIGLTIRDVSRRWYEHLYSFKNENCHNHNYPLYKAIEKYGIDNFEFSILEECDNTILSNREQYYIKQYNSYIGFSNSQGYNATLGGETAYKVERDKVYSLWEEGYAISEIAIQLHSSIPTISAIVKQHYPDIDAEIKQRGNCIISKKTSCKVKQYDEFGNFIAEYNSIKEAGESLPVENNISRAIQNHTKCGGFYWIKSDSDITIQDILNNPRGVQKKYKSVNQYSLDGIFIQAFSSVKEAKQKTGCCKIGEVCNGNRKTSGGYIWKWAD